MYLYYFILDPNRNWGGGYFSFRLGQLNTYFGVNCSSHEMIVPYVWFVVIVVVQDLCTIGCGFSKTVGHIKLIFGIQHLYHQGSK